MAILRDWICSKCNFIFEAFDDDAYCRKCLSTDLSQTFTKAPGIKSSKTHFADNLINDLVGAYGLSDFNNNESTRHDPPRSSNRGAGAIEAQWADSGIKVELTNGGMLKRKNDKPIKPPIQGREFRGTPSNQPSVNGLNSVRVPPMRNSTLFLEPDGKGGFHYTQNPKVIKTL